MDAPGPDDARAALGTLPLVEHGATAFTVTALVDPAELAGAG